MRYFQHMEPNEDGEDITVITTDEDIRRAYYPYWYDKMCKKYGKEHVDETYSLEECIEDWMIIHYAEEIFD